MDLEGITVSVIKRAETARLSSFIGAIAIGDLVKSTLGPKGMDKILLSSGRDASLMATNDGATILKNIGVDNPAAKVLVDIHLYQVTFLYLQTLFFSGFRA
uniref:T-complex protein 1 subunit beta n=1 Tax=Neovison vison TaxID=452646 RepID=A0A8C7BMR2_NEOVI